MYTLDQIFAALGGVENGGAMVADLQAIITGARNEAAANRWNGTRCWTPLASVAARTPKRP